MLTSLACLALLLAAIPAISALAPAQTHSSHEAKAAAVKGLAADTIAAPAAPSAATLYAYPPAIHAFEDVVITWWASPSARVCGESASLPLVFAQERHHAPGNGRGGLHLRAHERS